MSIDRLEFNSSFTKTVDVNVYLDNSFEEGGKPTKYLIAYCDGDMEDGFDYTEYEERIAQGEDFETIAQEIVDALESES